MIFSYFFRVFCSTSPKPHRGFLISTDGLYCCSDLYRSLGIFWGELHPSMNVTYVLAPFAVLRPKMHPLARSSHVGNLAFVLRPTTIKPPR